MNKLLDVTQILTNAYGEPVEDPVIKNRRVLLTSGKWKPLAQMAPSDDVATEPIKIGTLIINALDSTADKEMKATEKVERFMLSVRVAKAMTDGKPLEMSRDDERMIDAAADSLASNMAIARVKEALTMAKPECDAKSKARTIK